MGLLRLIAAALETPGAKAIITATLAIPAVRQEIQALFLTFMAEVFHRRQIDPQYLSQSDAAFSQWNAAETEEEKLAAQKSLAALSRF